MAPLFARRTTLVLPFCLLLLRLAPPSVDAARLAGYARPAEEQEHGIVNPDAEREIERRDSDHKKRDTRRLMKRRQRALRKGLVDRDQPEVNAVNTLEGFGDIKIMSPHNGAGGSAHGFDVANFDMETGASSEPNKAGAPSTATVPKNIQVPKVKPAAAAAQGAANTVSSGIKMTDFSWGRFYGKAEQEMLEQAMAAGTDAAADTGNVIHPDKGGTESNLMDEMMGEYGIRVFRGGGDSGATYSLESDGASTYETSTPTTKKPTAKPSNPPTKTPTVESDNGDSDVIDISGAANSVPSGGCSLCSDGAAPRRPTRTLLGSSVSCQQVATEFASATDDELCNAQKAKIPLNIEAYCGCPGASPTVTCTFCPAGETNIWHNITVDGLDGWTCQDVEDYVSLLTSANSCTDMNSLKEMCCGTDAEFWGEEEEGT